MSEDKREILLDLLTKKAVYGLDEAEEIQLDHMAGTEAELELRSFEMTAAAITIAGLAEKEELPAHLYLQIAADASQYVGEQEEVAESPWPPATDSVYVRDGSDSDRSSMSWFGWLGWAAAVAACIALALNLWFTRLQPPPAEQARIEPPVDTHQVLTPAENREAMMRLTPGMIKANWAAGNVKEMKLISGDVVWSDEKQAGYMRLRGLPVNDATKETYQLWIFDKTQDKATPIDGGTFDVSADGEVVIPINAKLNPKAPEMFAITVEKPGGVVVSKREKLAAIAKVETQPGQAS